MTKPKFQIGDIVYNKAERHGSYEPSICPKGSCLKVEQISRKGNIFLFSAKSQNRRNYQIQGTTLVSI